jgi:hypothetical protein
MVAGADGFGRKKDLVSKRAKIKEHWTEVVAIRKTE